MIKILIVEDSKGLREVYCEIIEFYLKEITLLTAENGKDGLLMANEYRPEIIITDYNMPKMNGIDFLKGVREGELNPKAAILISSDSSQIKELALKAGATHVLQKPVNILKDVFPILKDFI